MRYRRRASWYKRKVERSANLADSRTAIAIAVVAACMVWGCLALYLLLAFVQPFTL